MCSSNAIFWMEVSPQVAEAEEDVTDLKVLRTGTTPFAKMDYQAWMGISSRFKGGAYISTGTTMPAFFFLCGALFWKTRISMLVVHGFSDQVWQPKKASKHQLGHLISFTSWNPATQTSWQMYFLQPECLLVWIMLGNLASQTLQFSPQQVLREGKCQETQMGDLVRCRIGCGLGGFDFDWWQVFARK